MKISLTRSQRWVLAQLFYRTTFEGPDTLSAVRTFGRTRLALGLTPIMDVLSGGKKVNARLVDAEGGVAQAFELEEAQVEFLLGRILPGITTGLEAVALGPVLEDLQTYKLAGQGRPVEAPPYDKDSEQWEMPTDVSEPAASE